MLRKLWLMIFAISCASHNVKLPVGKPQGIFCTYNLELDIAYCYDMSTGIKVEMTAGNAMDKWIVMPPVSWKNIRNYQKALEENAK